MKSRLGGPLLSLLLALPLAFAAGLYFFRVPGDPPGFSIDESSICYNAWTISQEGRDEYGQPWPLFFRAFGEYKSSTLIYILAVLFRCFGPSIGAARLLTATLGVLLAAVLGLLAWRITRRSVAAMLVALMALLTPWFFEASRLVFEVALYPSLIGLFLLAAWGAHQRPKWQWSTVVSLATTLALLTYSYSIGRLLGPLLALGLCVFGNRQRWSGLANTWLLFGLLCVPLVLFHLHHPDALTGRFKALTYLSDDTPVLTITKEFAQLYLANIDPRRWLFAGENNVRDHVEGTGSLLAVTVVSALAGAIMVLSRDRRDPWWRFIFYSLLVSPVPGSLTNNPFPQLRLIAFPVFFLVLTLPAIAWLATPRLTRARIALMTASLVGLLGQGLWFQRCYHEKAPSLWYVFDGRFPRKVLSPALNLPARPIYLLDEPGKSGYIHALWYGVLTHLDPTTFARLPWGTAPPAGSTILSTEETCDDCRLRARALNYIVYSVPPYPPDTSSQREPLKDYRAQIVCENLQAKWAGGEQRPLSFLITNISPVEWPCLGDTEQSGAVILQTRWLSETGLVLTGSETHTLLPYDIEPSDTFGVTVLVSAPRAPGRYCMEADLVQKGGARFSEHGSLPFKVAVEVVP